MKLTLAEPKYFKDSVSIISELVNEARFKITTDAIIKITAIGIIKYNQIFLFLTP